MRNVNKLALVITALLAVSLIIPFGAESGDALSGRAVNDDISVSYTDDPSPVAFIDLAKKPANGISLAVYSTQEAQSVPLLPARISYAVELEPLSEGVYTFLVTDSISGATIAQIDVPIGTSQYMVLSFASGGGEGSMNPIFAGKGETVKLPACGFDTPSGKEFKCWSIDGKEYSVGDTITMDSDKTATAVWQEPSGSDMTMVIVMAVILIGVALVVFFFIAKRRPN